MEYFFCSSEGASMMRLGWFHVFFVSSGYADIDISEEGGD